MDANVKSVQVYDPRDVTLPSPVFPDSFWWLSFSQCYVNGETGVRHGLPHVVAQLC